MFWNRQPPKPPVQERFIVFIALKGGEGIAEYCSSHGDMMQKYFKYQKMVKENAWLDIDDATLRVDIIRYVRYITQVS